MPALHRPYETAAGVRDAVGDRPVALSTLLALGFTRGRIRSAVGAGTLVAVRRGVVRLPTAEEVGGTSLPSTESTSPSRSDHVERARAALLALADDSVVSHGSAAVIDGLPTYHRPPFDVWVTAPRHGRIVAGTHRRLGSIAPEDVVVIEGVRCTGVARTALDEARRRPPHVSLVALDAAVARVGLHELRAATARLEWVYDLKQLSLALSLASPLSESPLESMSRGWMHECGLPAPALQRWVGVGSGRRYRVDFLWARQRVIGEADGMGKYTSIRDVRAEKLREDELRRAGYTVVRWTYEELRRTPHLVIDRIRQALAG